MKEIQAIIQPFMFDRVINALRAIDGLPGLTVSQVIGWGRSQGVNAAQPVEEAGHVFGHKTRLEVVVSDDMAEKVVQAIAQAAHTGNPGDGKIFILDVPDALKIRTGARGIQAL